MKSPRITHAEAERMTDALQAEQKRPVHTNHTSQGQKMTDFLTRLTELAGAETAATLQAEFGGGTHYLPLVKRPQAQPVVVVMHGNFSPQHPIAHVAASLGLGLQALAASGVEVTAIGIQARGMGDAYIAALRGPLGLQGVRVEAML